MRTGHISKVRIAQASKVGQLKTTKQSKQILKTKV
jgi:hypothetical protein